MTFTFDNHTHGIHATYIMIKQFNFDDSNKAFAISTHIDISNNTIFHCNKLQIVANHLKYQLQNNENIGQYTNFNVSCISNNNGYSMSMDIIILINCFDIELSTGYTNHIGIITSDMRVSNYSTTYEEIYLRQIFHDNNLLLTLKDLLCFIVLMLCNIDLSNLNTLKDLYLIYHLCTKLMIYPSESLFYAGNILLQAIL